MLHDEDRWIYVLRRPRAYRDATARPGLGAEELARDGFVHASPVRHLTRVATTYFGDASELIVLVVDPEALTAPLRWERASGSTYPHVYGLIPWGAVVDARRMTASSEGFDIRAETLTAAPRVPTP